MQFDPNTWEAFQVACVFTILIVLVVALGINKRGRKF